ncbi:hypothetical protein [Streptococcus equi]|uniref:hypothetical protein n=1 Tax=Streptococcus equi TaxID=1336 RepID=UPI001E2A3CC3|nr:hypothetical protein [Streptococcus equi]
MKTSSRIQSDQSIFIWNVLGTSSTALISVILLMIVSRVLSKSASDTFSFAYAIGNQLITMAYFRLEISNQRIYYTSTASKTIFIQD